MHKTKGGNHMKPADKNRIPPGKVITTAVITALFLGLFLFFALTSFVSGTLRTVLLAVFTVGAVVGFCVSLWMILMYRAFSYNGKRQMSGQIIDGMKCYTAEALTTALKAAGFSEVSAARHPNKPWLTVIARK